MKEVLFQDDQQPQDLHMHMYRATVKNCMSRTDQANVEMKTDERGKGYKADSSFFHPHSKQANTPMQFRRNFWIWNFVANIC